MRSMMLALIVVLVTLGRHCSADEFVSIETIDLQKLSAHPSAAWINHALWPAEGTMRARAYSGDLSYEKSELIKLLQGVMREQCLPSEDCARIEMVGIAGLHNGDDYLLLRYVAGGGRDVRVMDGKSLFLMTEPPDQSPKPLSQVGRFVWETAEALLRFPQFEGQRARAPEITVVAPGARVAISKRPPYVPQLFVSPIDIGSSKTGSLLYGPRGHTPARGWYSSIRWWSDGKRVMFAISKLTEEDYARLATMAKPPLGPSPPRRFRSRPANEPAVTPTE